MPDNVARHVTTSWRRRSQSWRAGASLDAQMGSQATPDRRDCLSLGFDLQKTFLFSNFQYMGTMYPVVVQIQKLVSANVCQNVFGFDMSANIGKWSFAAIQAAPSFSLAFPQLFGGRSDVPCLIPCAIDQDPYFRLTRHIAPRLGWLKPALIHSKFFPALQGNRTKMSASSTNSAIFVDDLPAVVEEKIKHHAFSGGGDTKENQLAHGADLTVDVPYQWLSFFLEDDAKLAEIGKKYAAGDPTMMTGDVKKILIDLLNDMIAQHKRNRAAVSDDIIDSIMTVRKLK